MADFTTTITTTGVLNGNTYSVTQIATISGVTEVINRRLTVPSASEVELITIGAAVGAGQLTSLNQFVLINTDTVNFIRLRLSDTGGDTVDLKLEPGRGIIINNDQLSVSAAEGAFAAFANIDKIEAQADTADVIVEFIALEV